VKNRLLLGIMVILLTMSVISCELLLEKPAKPTIHALFVSLDYYNTSIRLNGTIRDAKEIESALSSLSTHFTIEMETTWMLQEGESPSVSSLLYPTPSNILNKIEELKSGLTEQDILFIYYSGHGYDPSESNPIGGDLAVAVQESETATSTLYINDVLNLLNTIQRGKVIFVLDSCYSGNFVPDYPTGYPLINNDFEYNSRVFVLSASSKDNVSYERPIFRTEYESQLYDYTVDADDPRNHIHGVFTDLFLKGLGWHHGDGTGEVIDSAGVLTTIDGEIVDTSDIPTLRNGSITTSDIYNYILTNISRQTPMTVSGPLDLVLFSEHW